VRGRARRFARRGENSPIKHYAFVIHQRHDSRSKPIQWNFAIMMNVEAGRLLAFGASLMRRQGVTLGRRR
jgi:hypothetical protein